MYAQYVKANYVFRERFIIDFFYFFLPITSQYTQSFFFYKTCPLIYKGFKCSTVFFLSLNVFCGLESYNYRKHSSIRLIRSMFY